MKKYYLLIIGILLILFAASCTSKDKAANDDDFCDDPFVLIGDRCCLDDDNDGMCDKFEEGSDPLTGEPIESVCGDSICSEGENKCSCAEDCGTCGGETDKTFFTCENNTCIEKEKQEYCGNSICEATESCNTCFQDCCEVKDTGVTLADYPGIAKGMRSVVGNKAPAQDVQNLDIIVRSLNKESIFIAENMLSDEVTDIRSRNYLVIGNPCDNPVAAELMKEEVLANDGCDVFAAGEAIIKLYATSSNTIALLVAGRTTSDTKRAAGVLAEYESYSLSGTELSIK